MLRVGGVLVALTACSAPVRRDVPPVVAPHDAAVVVDAAPDAPPEPVVEADYELPVASPSVSDCRPALPKAPAAKNPHHKRKTYDFAAITLRPLRHGPALNERPYIGYDRTLERARGVFYERSKPVTECWHWASARGARETTLAVELTLDARGSTSGVTVTSAQTGDDDLIACVTDMLTPPVWRTPRAHATRVHTFLAFNNDMAPRPTPPTRPKAPISRSPKPLPVACASPNPPPDDDIFLPLLVVTNYDDARATNGLVMPQRFQCFDRTRDVDKTAIRIGLRSQQGALDTCYADALARTPTLVGDLGATLVLDNSGYARRVEVAGVGDKALHTCVTTALAALWVVPTVPPIEVAVNLAFTLSPAPTSNDPNVLLENGNPEAALAEWVSTLRAPHLPYQGCLAHAGIVQAMAVVAPWLDDNRVRIAIENLARSALALPPAEARSCVETLDGFLVGYVRLNGKHAPPRIEARVPIRYLDRYEVVLPLAALFEWGSRLRWHHASWLLHTDRASEGEDVLAELASDPIVGADVTHWLAERAKRPEMLHDRCGP